MVSVTVRYLNGGHLTLENCDTVGGIMVQVAVLHGRFASGVAVFCSDTYTELTEFPSQRPPPQVCIVLKQEENLPAEGDLKLALKLHAEQDDTATCVRALELLHQSYPKARPEEILVDVVKDGSEIQWKILHTLLRAGIDGTGVVFASAQSGDVDTVRTLLAASAHPDARGLFRKTALMAACKKGDGKVVDMLLSNGANVNLVGCIGNKTALSIASKHGNDKVVEMLCSNGADVNRADDTGATPLIAAAFEGHDKIVEVLLSNGANVNGGNGTALRVASYCGHDKTADTLLCNGANVNLVDGITHQTALSVASQEGHNTLVGVLLSHRADANTVDKDGYTALARASHKGHDTIVEMLLSNGACVNPEDKARTSDRGCDKAVHARSHCTDVNQDSTLCGTAVTRVSDMSHNTIADVLPANGDDVTHVLKTGDTRVALTRGSETGPREAAEDLLPNGDEISHVNKNYRCAVDTNFRAR